MQTRITCGSVVAVLKRAACEDEFVSRAAIATLEKWAPYDAEDLSAWTIALTSRSERLRAVAVKTVGEIAPDSEYSKQTLQPFLADKNPKVVTAALEGIGRWRTDSQSLVSKVEPLIYSKIENVALVAVQTLVKICPPTEYPIESARAILMGAPKSVRLEVLRAFIALGVNAKSAIPEMVDCLSDPDVSICNSALQALSAQGEAAISTAPMILRVIDNKPDSETASLAIEALVSLGESAIPSLAKVYKNSKSEKDSTRLLSALEKYRAAKAVSAILEAGENPKHPHGRLYLQFIASLAADKKIPFDPITKSITTIGGDDLALLLMKLTDAEVKNAFGANVKFLNTKAGGRPRWALLVLEAMDPTSVSAARRTEVLKRLKSLEEYDLSRTERKEANAAITKWEAKK